MKDFAPRLLDALLTAAICALALHIGLILFTGGYSVSLYGIPIKGWKVALPTGRVAKACVEARELPSKQPSIGPRERGGQLQGIGSSQRIKAQQPHRLVPDFLSSYSIHSDKAAGKPPLLMLSTGTRTPGDPLHP